MSQASPKHPLYAYLPNEIWIKEYPIRYAGAEFLSRMTVIRLSDGRLLLHSPCEIDPQTRSEIEALGQVAYIMAPGSYHYFYVPSAQAAFPEAETYLCPGIERKRPDLDFDWLLADRAPEGWAADLEQVLVRGNRLMWEVAMFHKASKTLILVDLLENFTDQTPEVNWTLKFWWKAIMHMWNHPKPAPEYQLGWKDKAAARQSLERILEWDFERVILAHGDLVEKDAQAVVRAAWKNPLEG